MITLENTKNNEELNNSISLFTFENEQDDFIFHEDNSNNNKYNNQITLDTIEIIEIEDTIIVGPCPPFIPEPPICIIDPILPEPITVEPIIIPEPPICIFPLPIIEPMPAPLPVFEEIVGPCPPFGDNLIPEVAVPEDVIPTNPVYTSLPEVIANTTEDTFEPIEVEDELIIGPCPMEIINISFDDFATTAQPISKSITHFIIEDFILEEEIDLSTMIDSLAESKGYTIPENTPEKELPQQINNETIYIQNTKELFDDTEQIAVI